MISQVRFSLWQFHTPTMTISYCLKTWKAMRFASDNNEDGSSKREQNENYLAYFIGETEFSNIFLRTIHWTDRKQVRCASGRSEIWCMQKSLRDFQWYITNISLEIPQYNIRLKFLAIFRPPLNRVQAVWIPDSGPKSYISLESSQALLHTPYLISSGCTSYLFTISYLLELWMNYLLWMI